MKRCLIECGVAQASEADALAMNVSQPGKNVNLRIDYISRFVIGNIPDLLIDLLEVAAYVYCADQRIARGSAMLTDFGADWRRSLTFAIPVRHPEIWQRADMQDILVDTLGLPSWPQDWNIMNRPRTTSGTSSSGIAARTMSCGWLLAMSRSFGTSPECRRRVFFLGSSRSFPRLITSPICQSTRQDHACSSCFSGMRAR